jgi:ubiquitin C-terminal hydrolase
MDYQTGAAVKIMTTVPFPPVFRYPSSVGGGVSSASDPTYCLYAVVVHSGTTLNGGHYYTFARSSCSQDLHLEDSPSGPWRKFDDREVSVTTFADIRWAPWQ